MCENVAMANTSRFKAAEYLKTEEQIVAYLAEAAEVGDTVFLREAVVTVEQARAMSTVSRITDRDGMSSPEGA
jgi:DNA-binding phage protein